MSTARLDVVLCAATRCYVRRKAKGGTTRPPVAHFPQHFARVRVPVDREGLAPAVPANPRLLAFVNTRKTICFMTSFESLGLSAPLLKALATEGYTTPTPIQAQAIPHVLAGRDRKGIAQTGTGKIPALALPILQRLGDNRRPPARGACRVLVLSPTREITSQIVSSFRTYSGHMGARVALMIG